MILIEHEIHTVIEQAQRAFPHFTDWEYNNEVNESYSGFSLWGQFVLYPEPAWSSRRLFITLDTYEDSWGGCVSIGQHYYRWSSANVGDALILNTPPCDTLEEAIIRLKEEIRNLFQAFSLDYNH